MADNKKVLPRHVGIIMDGNGRWAKQRGLERSEGHKQGAKVFRKICDYANDIGIECITFYAFSTENWRRPPEEVAAIMDLFRDYLYDAQASEEDNERRQMRINFIGDRNGLPDDIVALMEEAETKSIDKNHIIVNIAINYGGRQEIAQAVRKLAQKAVDGEINAEEITEENISDMLYTSGQPDPDLIIRPSGEYRLSNFLIWQSAYAEFWYSDILWPDFTESDFDKAMEDFAKRNRRFGGV